MPILHLIERNVFDGLNDVKQCHLRLELPDKVECNIPSRQTLLGQIPPAPKFVKTWALSSRFVHSWHRSPFLQRPFEEDVV